MTQQHPAAAPAIRALADLASAAFGLDGVTPGQARLIGQHLELAGQTIAGAASDWIDRAREATGAEWAR